MKTRTNPKVNNAPEDFKHQTGASSPDDELTAMELDSVAGGRITNIRANATPLAGGSAASTPTL